MLPFAPTASLPRMMQDLVDRLGFSSALTLVEKLGGTTVPVPMRRTSQGEARFLALCDTVDTEIAEALCREYGGTDLYIPSCRQALVDVRNAEIVRERDALAHSGASEREIVTALALEFGMSDRNIWRILKKPVQADVLPATRLLQMRMW